MSGAFEHLMADVSRLTACRTKCPRCGHVGMASWTRSEDVCRCRECGQRFRFKENTYRPLTEGMDEEERRRFYKRNRGRYASDMPLSQIADPAERERQRDMRRARNRRYYARKMARGA